MREGEEENRGRRSGVRRLISLIKVTTANVP